MIDKFKKWFFTEEGEEDYFDGKELLDNYEEEEELEIPAYEEKVTTFKEISKEEVVPPLPKVEAPTPKITIDIKADEPIQVEEPVRQTRPLSRREEYEMPQVISPYFGVKGEELASAPSGVEKSVSTPKKKDSFNSVISPFYGTRDVKPYTGQVETKQEETETIQSSPSSPISFLHANEVLEEEMPEEEVNIALDEIVSSRNEEEDDLIQFSLFGGSEKIQRNEFENEEWDQDKEEDTDSLPF